MNINFTDCKLKFDFHVVDIDTIQFWPEASREDRITIDLAEARNGGSCQTLYINKTQALTLATKIIQCINEKKDIKGD